MTRFLLMGSVALLVLANAIPAQPPQPSQPPTPEASQEEAEAKMRDLLSRVALSTVEIFTSHSPIRSIGSLAQPPYATDVLGLTKEQMAAITKLDEVVRASRYVLSLLTDAEAVGNRPAVRQRNAKRRQDAIGHAARLVTLGFLTERQAAYVMQSRLKSDGVNALLDDDVAELFGLSARQRQELAQRHNQSVQAEISPIPEPMDLPMETAPDYVQKLRDQEEYYQEMRILRETRSEVLWTVLTPSQQVRWLRVVSAAISPVPPRGRPEPLSAAAERRLESIRAEAERARKEPLSPTFRALTEKGDALKLEDEQKALIKSLEEVTRGGLSWIVLRAAADVSSPEEARAKRAEQVAATRAEFVRRAAQVALLGILTERQAEQLQAAMKER